MNALVVYESMYGNTAAVASAVADGIAASGVEARCRPVGEVDRDDARSVDLLVLGGPTHAHGMTRQSTRQTAVSDEKNAFAAPTLTPGLREWIDDLSDGEGQLAAAFDTRIDKPILLTGSAARGIARRLGRGGFRVITEPESFLVTTQNRLLAGEIDHGVRWGSRLASTCLTLTP
jgi:flavodoxin